MQVKQYISPANRKALRWFFIVALIWLGANLPDLYADETGPTIVRVEEDWELVLTEPNAQDTAPQVTCVIAPYSPNDAFYAVLEINHRTIPSFHAGGLQLQLWSYDQVWVVNSATAEGSLQTSGEHVTWTQSVYVEDGEVAFSVTGDSDTWGSFGDDGDLVISLPTGLETLNGYNPEYSVANSGIGFASNRVASLKLLRVRYYSSEGLVTESDTPLVVFEND